MPLKWGQTFVLDSFLSKLLLLCTLILSTGCGQLTANISSTKSSASDSSSNALPSCIDNALNAESCAAAASRFITNIYGSNINGTNGSLTTPITAGYYDGTQSCSMSDTSLTASNIKSGTTIFGITGNYTETFNSTMASSAMRDPGSKVISNLADLTSTSSQLSLNHEVTTYAGADLPNASGYSYRDIPDMSQDDEGYLGTNCKYAPRPSVDCGTSQASIALRIADCQTANPSTNSWNGATQCNGGQGLWRLVARSGANKEVWQDQRTGLLWSSVVGSVNWCRATGNTQLTPLTFINSFNNSVGTPIQGNGTIGALASGASSNTETVTITFTDATTFSVTSSGGAAGCQGGSITPTLTTTPGSQATYSDAGECSFTITQGTVNFATNDKFTLQNVGNATYSCAAGGPLQPASPLSYCAEAAGVNAGAPGDDWTTPDYVAAKGKMGKNSVPSVRWRAPSIDDYKLADVNGVRFIMPDMGIAGASRPSPDGSVVGNSEWSSSLVSSYRVSAWYFLSDSGNVSYNNRNSAFSVRCVGR